MWQKLTGRKDNVNRFVIDKSGGGRGESDDLRDILSYKLLVIWKLWNWRRVPDYCISNEEQVKLNNNFFWIHT